LVAFFRIRFPVQSETLADDALDRLARRLAQGTPVDNLEAYAHGIARLMLLEEGNRQRKQRRAAVEALHDAVTLSAEPDAALPILKSCLESLGHEAATFILDYYAADGGTDRIERRQRMAEGSGVSLNALRNRALRIRLSLEKCVRLRLQYQHSNLPMRDELSNSDTLDMLEDDPP
jgi:DNA-directed RNA polymerase specialized sigma24 family protein